LIGDDNRQPSTTDFGIEAKNYAQFHIPFLPFERLSHQASKQAASVVYVLRPLLEKVAGSI
jgi:hypothetical protein